MGEGGGAGGRRSPDAARTLGFVVSINVFLFSSQLLVLPPLLSTFFPQIQLAFYPLPNIPSSSFTTKEHGSSLVFV